MWFISAPFLSICSVSPHALYFEVPSLEKSCSSRWKCFASNDSSKINAHHSMTNLACFPIHLFSFCNYRVVMSRYSISLFPDIPYLSQLNTKGQRHISICSPFCRCQYDIKNCFDLHTEIFILFHQFFFSFSSPTDLLLYHFDFLSTTFHPFFFWNHTRQYIIMSPLFLLFLV